jgi:hypothetical protein
MLLDTPPFGKVAQNPIHFAKQMLPLNLQFGFLDNPVLLRFTILQEIVVCIQLSHVIPLKTRIQIVLLFFR